MPIIQRESGAGDKLLRPLCAKLLDPTLPEREGWVDREKLHAFHGRSRKPQMDLAQHFGFTEYAQPAGGCCFLTDASYSDKLSDLWQSRGTRLYDLDDIMLLKVGRHLRPRPHFKLIVGREEGENNFMEGYRKQFTHVRIISHEGPLVLIDGQTNADDLELAARIAARYSQGREADSIEAEINFTNGDIRCLRVAPMRASEIPQEWYV
jgi:tRNA U34 2-thiouridine synthase MnmA/TrmU